MARKHSGVNKNNNRIIIILITGIVVVAAVFILTEIQGTYLRTTVIPIEQQDPAIPPPSETTKQYRGAIKFDYPSNWEVTVKDNEITVGPITFFPNPENIATLRQRVLQTTDIIFWDGQIGPHEALYSAKTNKHIGTIAPIGDRLVVYGSQNVAALIPEPPRSEAVQNILNSVEIGS